MKKFIIVFALFLTICANSFAQTETFAVGWYQVQSGAQVKVVQGNSDDTYKEEDWTRISYAAGEVLIAFNYSKDIYYCFDPDGRVVLIKGKASLKKIDVAGRPGRIKGEVKLNLDQTLSEGNNFWLTSYNTVNKTAIILLADGTKQEIPQENIVDLKGYYDMMDRLTEYHTVQ